MEEISDEQHMKLLDLLHRAEQEEKEREEDIFDSSVDTEERLSLEETTDELGSGREDIFDETETPEITEDDESMIDFTISKHHNISVDQIQAMPESESMALFSQIPEDAREELKDTYLNDYIPYDDPNEITLDMADEAVLEGDTWNPDPSVGQFPDPINESEELDDSPSRVREVASSVVEANVAGARVFGDEVKDIAGQVAGSVTGSEAQAFRGAVRDEAANVERDASEFTGDVRKGVGQVAGATKNMFDSPEYQEFNFAVKDEAARVLEEEKRFRDAVTEEAGHVAKDVREFGSDMRQGVGQVVGAIPPAADKAMEQAIDRPLSYVGGQYQNWQAGRTPDAQMAKTLKKKGETEDKMLLRKTKRDVKGMQQGKWDETLTPPERKREFDKLMAKTYSALSQNKEINSYERGVIRSAISNLRLEAAAEDYDKYHLDAMKEYYRQASGSTAKKVAKNAGSALKLLGQTNNEVLKITGQLLKNSRPAGDKLSQAAFGKKTAGNGGSYVFGAPSGRGPAQSAFGTPRGTPEQSIFGARQSMGGQNLFGMNPRTSPTQKTIGTPQRDPTAEMFRPPPSMAISQRTR